MKTITGLALAYASLRDHSPGEVIGRRNANRDMRLYPPTTIEWKEGPAALPAGAKVAVLEGDPTKEGPFVIRLQFPDGIT